MSKHTQDSCNWQLAYVLDNTRPFPEAVWLCACGAMKQIAHHIAGYRMHPDKRVAQMRARATVEENGDEAR